MLATSRRFNSPNLIIRSIAPGSLLRHVIAYALLAGSALLFASADGLAAARSSLRFQQYRCNLLDIEGCTKIIESRRFSVKARVLAYLTRAQMSHLIGKNQDAIADYSEVIRLDPKRAEAYCERGSAREMDKRPDDAMADYSEGLRLEPNNTKCLRARASLFFFGLSKYRSAIADYTRLVRISPHDGGVLEDRGNVWMERGMREDRDNAWRAVRDFDHAIADFSAALSQRRQSDDEMIYVKRAHAWAFEGHPLSQEASAAHRKSRQSAIEMLYTERATAWSFKGHALSRADYKSTEARSAYLRGVADYTQIIKLHPRNVLTIEVRAGLWGLLGNHGEAIADWNEILRIAPNEEPAFRGRAEAWAAKGDFDRAINDLTEAIRIDSDELAKSALSTSLPDLTLSYPFENRAELFVAKGDFAKAIADFDEILRLWPDQQWPIWRRAPSEYLLGQLDAAATDLSRGVELNPTSAETALWLEIVNRRLQRPSRLADARERLDMTKWPAPIVRLYLGETTLENVLAAVDNPRPAVKRAQLCDARFYGAELASLKGSNPEALHLFHLAAAQCAKDSLLRSAADVELRRANVLRER